VPPRGTGARIAREVWPRCEGWRGGSAHPVVAGEPPCESQERLPCSRGDLRRTAVRARRSAHRAARRSRRRPERRARVTRSAPHTHRLRRAPPAHPPKENREPPRGRDARCRRRGPRWPRPARARNSRERGTRAPASTREPQGRVRMPSRFEHTLRRCGGPLEAPKRIGSRKRPLETSHETALPRAPRSAARVPTIVSLCFQRR